MALPIAEIVGTVIGGFIAGLVGLLIANHTHRLAVNDAKEAARKAKKKVLQSCLLEVKQNQSEIKRLLKDFYPEKTPYDSIISYFSQTIYSTLVDRLGELECGERIVAYYISLEIEPHLKPSHFKFGDLREVPWFNSISDARLAEIIRDTPNNKVAQFYAAAREKMNEIAAEGGKLVECLEQEIIAGG
jgi:hypothetical protein